MERYGSAGPDERAPLRLDDIQGSVASVCYRSRDVLVRVFEFYRVAMVLRSSGKSRRRRWSNCTLYVVKKGRSLNGLVVRL